MKTPDLVGSPSAYATDSCLSSAVNRVGKHLPKSPGKKHAVVKELECKVKLSFKKTKTMLAKQNTLQQYNKKSLIITTPQR